MKDLFCRLRENEKIDSFIEENKPMLKKVAAAAAVVVVAFLFFLFKGGSDVDSEADEVKVSESTSAETEVKSTLYVDIGGEVKKPQLVELPEGSRIEDAIDAAGGVTSDADMTQVNRAAFVSDGEKIIIPSSSDGENADASGSTSGDASSSGNGVSSDGKININTADSEELQELNGVGPVTAEKIITYRQENGNFSSIEDIKNVSGIGDKTFEKLKDDIRI